MSTFWFLPGSDLSGPVRGETVDVITEVIERSQGKRTIPAEIKAMVAYSFA